MSVVCELKNRRELKKKLERLKDAPEKAMKAMNRDAKKAVKGIVQAEIVRTYNVTPAQLKSNELGTIRVKGKVLDALEFQYRGRPLTPTHFSMSPTSPPGGAYTLSATFVRGSRKTLGEIKELTPAQRKKLAKNFKHQKLQTSRKSPIMLMPAGKNSGKYIPFQRQSPNRKDIKAIKSTSLPQMVSSYRTQAQIQTAIQADMSKRLDGYLNKYLPGD